MTELITTAEEAEAFYREHYSGADWSVVQVDLRIYVPMASDRIHDAIPLIQSTLDEGSWDMRAVPLPIENIEPASPVEETQASADWRSHLSVPPREHTFPEIMRTIILMAQHDAGIVAHYGNTSARKDFENEVGYDLYAAALQFLDAPIFQPTEADSEDRS